MRNRGGLTLVSPIYFSFGRNLMAAVRNETNQETISEKKMQVWWTQKVL